MLSLPEIWPLRAAAVRLVLAASGDVPSRSRGIVLCPGKRRNALIGAMQMCFR